MKRILPASFGFLFLAALVASSSSTLLAATKTVAGKVSAVSADAITVAGKDGDLKLVVDSKTTVVGRGLGTKSKELKGENKPTQITDLVKVGDEVSAKYDDASKHADEVRVTKAAAPAAKK